MDSIGLFGYSGYDTELKNIRVINATVSGFYYAGVLAGWHGGNIKNCIVSGTVKGRHTVGGLVGRSNGAISDCHADVDVEGDYCVGGLVGVCSSGSLLNSSSDGYLRANECAGGLLGRNSGSVDNCLSEVGVSGELKLGGIAGINFGKISNSSATGGITGNEIMGGIVGENYRTVFGCRSSSHLEGENRIGGIVGENNERISESFADGGIVGKRETGGAVGYNSGSILDSYSLTPVSGKESAGGLIGLNNYGEVFRCYSSGSVLGLERGGLVGKNSGGTVNASFWDVDTSGMSESDGGSGVHTEDMVRERTFTGPGWDLDLTWDIIDNKSYPFLRCFDYGDPEITTENVNITYEDEPYLVDYDAYSPLPGNREAVLWNLATNARGWLNISDKGVISGVPENDDVGQFWVNITSYINEKSYDFTNFTLEVINVNDRPHINTTSIPDAVEDQFYCVEFEAFDDDHSDNELRWSIVTQAEFLRIDPVNGTLSGTPENKDVGDVRIDVYVIDEQDAYDSKSYQIYVENVNDDPVIQPFEIPAIEKYENFSIELYAVDVDPLYEFEWGMKTSANFLKMNGNTGRITGFARTWDEGTWSVTVYVTDGHGGKDSVTFDLVVPSDDNLGPELNVSSLNLTFDEDTTGIIDLNDVFHDPDGDSLEFYCLRVGNMSVSIEDGIAHITPEPNWCGSDRIVFAASDGNGSVTLEADIFVTPVNDPPANVTIVGDSEYYQDEKVFLEGSASDPDLPYGDTLSYVWSSNKTGVIDSTRSLSCHLKVGLHNILLTVTDSEGVTDVANMEVLIKPNPNEDDDIDDDLPGNDTSQTDERGDEIPWLWIILGLSILIISALMLSVFLFERRSDRFVIREE